MFALSTWLPSGRPAAVLAPSSVWVSPASPARPAPVLLLASKLPAASVNPIGAASRWSCHLLTKKNTCAAFCARFACHENGVLGSQEQGNGLPQNDTSGSANGLSREFHRLGLGPDGATSSGTRGWVSSLTSGDVGELFPASPVAFAARQPLAAWLAAP